MLHVNLLFPLTLTLAKFHPTNRNAQTAIHYLTILNALIPDMR